MVSLIGYQYVPMSILILLNSLQIFAVTVVCLVYTMFIIFKNLDSALKNGSNGFTEQTTIKVMCGIHLAVTLLLMKLTGAI